MSWRCFKVFKILGMQARVLRNYIWLFLSDTLILFLKSKACSHSSIAIKKALLSPCAPFWEFEPGSTLPAKCCPGKRTSQRSFEITYFQDAKFWGPQKSCKFCRGYSRWLVLKDSGFTLRVTGTPRVCILLTRATHQGVMHFPLQSVAPISFRIGSVLSAS